MEDTTIDKQFPVTECSLKYFFTQNTYRIPFYQRDFVWRKEETEDLLKDIENAEKKGRSLENCYFIGTVFIGENKKDKGKTNCYDIIDGQQRITVISLIFKQLLLLNSMKKYYSELEKYLFTGTGFAKESKLRLIWQGSGDTSNIYRSIIEENGEERSYNREKLLSQTNNEIKDFFEKKSDEYRESYYKFLISNVRIICISSLKDTDPYEIFEILNAKGEPLRASELIKNKLFSYFDVDFGKDAMRKWNYFKHAEFDKKKLKIKNNKRTIEDYIEDYLMVYLETKNDKIINEKKTRYFYSGFKEYIERNGKENAKNNAKKFVDDALSEEIIDKYITKAPINGNRDSYTWKFLTPKEYKEIEKFFPFLNDITVCHPTIFSILYNWRERYPDRILPAYRVIWAFICRVRAVRTIPVTEMSESFSKIAYKITDNFINSSKDLFIEIKNTFEGYQWGYIFDDAEFKKEVADRGSKNKYHHKRILIDIYNFIHKEELRKDSTIYLTLEHIRPDSNRERTKEAYKNFDSHPDVDREWLGNKVLLHHKLNKEASDKPFAEKREIYKRSSLQPTKEFGDTHINWSGELCIKRQRHYAQLLTKVYTFSPKKD